MKTYKHLYPQLCSFDNLYLAYLKAKKGKSGKPPVAAFMRKREDEIFALQNELQTKTYAPGAYHSFYVHDPKKRLISAAPFRDRVVHHALCRVMEPIWERRFIHDSYANRISFCSLRRPRRKISLGNRRRGRRREHRSTIVLR